MVPVVSVIMPVYNAEKYLENAVDSVLRQSFGDLELLLIDDGSTDASGEICDRYSVKDQRVRVVHQTNAGRCAARNRGIELARGRYIAFCDNDDEYEINLLQDNIDLAVKHDADLIRFARRRFIIHRDNVIDTVDEPKQEDNIYVFSDVEVYKNMGCCKKVACGVWACIFSREFLLDHHIAFDTEYRHGFEDYKFIMECYYHLQTVVYNPRIYYNWYSRTGQSDSANITLERLSILDDLISVDKRLYMDKMSRFHTDYWTVESTMYVLWMVRHIILSKPTLTGGQARAALANLKLELWKDLDFHLIFDGPALKNRAVALLFYNNCYWLLFVICRIMLKIRPRG